MTFAFFTCRSRYLQKCYHHIGVSVVVFYIMASIHYLYSGYQPIPPVHYDIQPQKTLSTPQFVNIPNHTTRVLLLSYQRCGSSFIGQILNHNPDAYYVFEPLDSVYVSMYGTGAGWNVPSDITHHWNGTARKLPFYEHSTLASSLNSILSCDMDSLPTEYFTHTFWSKFPKSLGRLVRFQMCMSKLKSSLTDCGTHLRTFCPQRFGEDTKSMEECHDHLQHSKETNSKIVLAVNKYTDCLKSQRQKSEPCIQEMNMTCWKSPIRSTKTVRLTMESVRHLLKLDPGLKVIHLFRDPRPVALSRMGRQSFRGHFAGKDMLMESQMYCKTVLTDVILRKKLAEDYPSTFYQLVYENFVTDPIQKTREIYDFLKVPFSEEVKFWLELNTTKSKNSTATAKKWQDKLTYRQSRQIQLACLDLFREVNDVWE